MSQNSSAYEAFIGKYSDKKRSEISSDYAFEEKYELNNSTDIDFDTFEDKLALWVAYWRKFPHTFIETYFNIHLNDLQIFLSYILFDEKISSLFFAATRGLGKTFLVSLMSLVASILKSNLKVIIASGVLSQGYQLLLKIDEIRGFSSFDWYPLEIIERNDSMNSPKPNLKYASGSYTKIVTNGESARGHRANWLLCEEAILIPEDSYNFILKRMASSPRYAPYMALPQYKNMPKEKNKVIFLTSVKGSDSWCYGRYQTHLKFMKEKGYDSPYYVIALPYQVSVMYGLLSKEDLILEVSESNFSLQAFLTELNTIWSKTITDGYYSLGNLDACRTITHPAYPTNIREEIGTKDFEKEKKGKDEIRILSCDIALMASTSSISNDNTALTYIKARPNKNGTAYIREVKYIEAISGGIPIDEHTLRIRELYDEFNCDYIVLDCAGIGLTIYNGLTRNFLNRKTGEMLPAYGCINDDEMQKLVADQSGDRIIYSIKASLELNKKMYSDLQSRIIKRQLKLPIETRQADTVFAKNKKYPEWITSENAMYKQIMKPYSETDELVNEMINLKLVDADKIKLVERGGRKDRFSSLTYGSWVITTLETDLLRSNNFNWNSYRASSRSSGYKQAVSY